MGIDQKVDELRRIIRGEKWSLDVSIRTTADFERAIDIKITGAGELRLSKHGLVIEALKHSLKIWENDLKE